MYYPAEDKILVTLELTSLFTLPMMVAENKLSSLTSEQLKNIQANSFVLALKELATDPKPLISNLVKVKNDQENVRKWKDNATKEAGKSVALAKDISLMSIVNALIAFTYGGLQIIQDGVKSDLELIDVKRTDPAFFKGMDHKDTINTLSDPAPDTWDPLFRSGRIHGMLKIAGSSIGEVQKHLEAIKGVLQRRTAIEDAFQTESDSRVDGWTRPHDRGKEHFGFQDGISQLLMNGIDELDRHEPPNMNTDPSLIIVTPRTHHEGGSLHPKWMYDGSFVVFRKLEQNVKAFEDLTGQWERYNCLSKAHMGAKLVGRWPSGAPIAKFPTADTTTTTDPEGNKSFNDFYYNNEICPVSAHIRKINIREIISDNDKDSRAKRTRIIRNGIPYGPDYTGDKNDNSTRGLLFACYQGAIEDGFEHMQSSWSNASDFRTGTPGHDPIIGQTRNQVLKTEITDRTNQNKVNVPIPQLVTLKGGGYFFAPSIKALSDILGDVVS